jgi:hypothetical protein
MVEKAIGEGWISGTPPDNIFFQTWWVWDGKEMFLAHWRRDLQVWELAESSFYNFRPENITHYHTIEQPNKPLFEEIYK